MTIKVSDCFKAGAIIKTHGLNGGLVIRSEYNLELLELDEPVFVIVDGLPVPLFINEIIEKNYNSYIVYFDFVETALKAKEFVGSDVFAPKHILSNQKIDFISQVMGIEVFDKSIGYIGICHDIELIPGNPQMIVNNSGTQFFIPIVDEWVVELVPNKRIVLDCPQGLFNV